MVEAPPNGMPQFYPSMTYEDAVGAIAFLTKAFGFEELAVHTGEGEGSRQVEHAELRFGTGILMMGSPRPDRPGEDSGHRTPTWRMSMPIAPARRRQARRSRWNRMTTTTAVAATECRTWRGTSGSSGRTCPRRNESSGLRTQE